MEKKGRQIKMELWYAEPSGQMYENTLPLGNGILGATVFGGISEEKIIFNHTHLWRHAKTMGRENPVCTHYLKLIRELMFKGELEQANELAYRTLGTQWNEDVEKHAFGPDPFVPVGQLDLIFPSHEHAENYRNSLNISSGIATTSYGCNGTKFKREYITSMDKLIFASRITAEGREKINGFAGLSRKEDDACESETILGNASITLQGIYFENVRFAAELRVICHGGRLCPVQRNGREMLEITEADSVELFLFAATDREADLPPSVFGIYRL